MKIVSINESIEFRFSACDSKREFMKDKLEEMGFSFRVEKIDNRTDRFIIEPRDLNVIYIQQLADLFRSR